MRPRLEILSFVLATLSGNAQPLAEGQIRVGTTLVQPGVRLASEVRLLDHANGARVIEVRLANRTARDVELLGAEVEFPWIVRSGPDFLVAAGGMSSGRWPPTLVFDPARDKTEPVSILLNWGETARTYSASGLPVGSAVIRGNPEVAREEAGARITLASRHAAIFHLPAGTEFDQARKAIRVE